MTGHRQVTSSGVSDVIRGLHTGTARTDGRGVLVPRDATCSCGWIRFTPEARCSVIRDDRGHTVWHSGSYRAAFWVILGVNPGCVIPFFAGFHHTGHVKV